MKKTYSKPEILFESFTMNISIASSCTEPFGSPGRGTCAIPGNFPGWDLFNTTIEGSACQVDGDENEKYNGLCYHVPTADAKYFAS